MTWTMAFSWLLDSPLRAEPDMMFSLGVGGERDTENYGSKLTRRVTWALLHHRIGDTLVLVPRVGSNATPAVRRRFLASTNSWANQHQSAIDLRLWSAHSPLHVRHQRTGNGE